MTEESSTAEMLDFIRELRGLLRFHQQLGLDFYPFVLPESKVRMAARAAVAPAAGLGKSIDIGQQGQALEAADLDRAIAGCRNCPRGGAGVTALAGEGKAGADLFIVVEQTMITAPEKGRLLDEEDRALLEKMLAAIKIAPAAIYLAPLVKCGSAEPTTRQERSACLTLLEQQIACLRPRAILVFGEQAAQALFRSDQPLFHLRGKTETVQDLPVLASYHPAQLRRETALKQMAWQDLQLLQRVLAGKKVSR